MSSDLESATLRPAPTGGYWQLPNNLSEFIEECIEAPKGYLMGILITSGSQGREESLGLDFGLGKSTFLGQLGKMIAYRWDDRIPDTIVPEDTFKALDLANRPIRRAWEKTKPFWMYFPWEIFDILDFPFRALCGQYDDFNVTLGKAKSNNPRIRNLADDLKNKRTHLAIFAASASHIDDIAAPFRSFFKFEVIIPIRGVFEAQLNKKYKNYWDPEKDQSKMRYKGTGTFEMFPKHMEDWYDRWREVKLQRNKNVTRMKILDLFSKDYDVEDLIEKYAHTLGGSAAIPKALDRPDTSPAFDDIEQEILRVCLEEEGVTIYQLKGMSKRHYNVAKKLKSRKLLEMIGQGSQTMFITEKGREVAMQLAEIQREKAEEVIIEI